MTLLKYLTKSSDDCESIYSHKNMSHNEDTIRSETQSKNLNPEHDAGVSFQRYSPKIEPQHDKTNKMACAPSEDSD